MRRRVSLVCAAALRWGMVLAPLVGVGAPRRAFADGPAPAPRASDAPPTADRLRSAAVEFDAGRRAYQAGDHAGAAGHFENAYHDAPRAESLRSAIRAHRAAKQLARAASLAAVARVRYESDAPTVALATEVLDDAAARLHEVRVACTPACGIAADGRAVSLDDATSFRFFLDAGHHELTVSWANDRGARVVVEARAGGKDAFTLTAPPPKTEPPAAPQLSALPPDARPPRRKPLSPVVFVVGASLTAVGAGATVLSGLDTLASPGADVVRERCVGVGESCAEYQQGRDAQLRTNVLLAATGGLFVATAVVGLFFTQWTSPVAPASRRGAVYLLPAPSLIPGGLAIGAAGTF